MMPLKGCTERVNKCAQRIFTPPAICTERLRYYTQVYKETEGEPALIRQSRAFERTLLNMTVKIADGELIAGYACSKERGGAVLAEVNAGWLKDELDSMSERQWDKFLTPSPEEKEEIFRLLEYWEGKSAYEIWKKKVPEKALKLLDSGFAGGVTFASNGFYPGHVAPDYEKVLRGGLKSIYDDAAERLKKPGGGNTDEKRLFYEAVMRELLSVKAFSERYSSLAAEMAAKERDKKRQAELLEISRICSKVPWYPAETFREALQAVYTLWVCLMIEGWGHGITISRAEQFLFPYYEKDLAEKRITKAAAKELLELFFIKLNATVTIDDYKTATCFAGFPQAVNITLGGTDKEGGCAENEMTFLLMEAEADIGMTAEDLVIRVSDKSSDRYMLEAARLSKRLKGKLKFVSDPVALAQMKKDGYPKELSWDYAVTGCNSPCIAGKSLDLPGGLFNLPLLLEFALNDGRSRISGEQIGPRTGNPELFKSYEELWQAFCTQVDYFTEPLVCMSNFDRQVFAERLPLPFQSALMDGPMEKGFDLLSGGCAPLSRQSYSLSGAPDAGDGLAALKKCVFDEKILTMEEVIAALDCDFKGCLRVFTLLAGAPKFGNGDPYVDDIVDDVIRYCSNKAGEHMAFCGLPFKCAAATISSNVPLGLFVGALPCTRRKGEPISEGGISPHQGRNVSGPTATLNSVAGLSHELLSNGSVLNMRFDPEAIKDDDKLFKFAMMTKAYLLSGGFFVQYNIVGADTLKAAQKEPEKYKDLLVRVATYSAYFTELSPKMQEDIISRTEFKAL